MTDFDYGLANHAIRITSDPNPRLAVWDSARFAEKSLILLLFCRDGKFHPRGAGEGNDGPIGF